MEMTEKTHVGESSSYKLLEGHESAVFAAVLWSSANHGNLLVSAGEDRTVRLWNVDSATCTCTMRGHEDGVVCLAVSPNNALDPLIASGSTDKTIILWSLLSGKKVCSLTGHRSVVTDVSIFIDQQKPILVSAGSDSSIICWDLSDGSIIRCLSSHNGPVSSLVTVHARIPLIVSGGDDKLINVWDLRSGALIKSLTGHSSEINVLSISSDESNPIIVSGAADGSIFVWDLLGLEFIFQLQSAQDVFVNSKSEVSSISITSGIFPVILVSSWTSTIHVWDSKSGGLLCILNGAHVKRVCVVSNGKDETGPIFLSGGFDSNIAIWSPFEDMMGNFNLCSIDDMSLEESLVLAGKYLCCWNLLNQNEISNEDAAVFSNKEVLSLVFYSLIRMGHINPRMIRVKAMALSYVMSKAIHHIDLLFYDSLVGNTPLHFLLKNRLCLQNSQRWMKIESNIGKVIQSLENPKLSSETLDSVLRGVVCNDEQMSGWDTLLHRSSFTDILRNLMLNSKKSHSCIATMIKNFGIEPATEPFPVPLTIPNPRPKNVVRWNENVIQGQGLYYYRLKANPCLDTDYLLSSEFFALIADSSNVDEFVSAPLVEYLIQYKWEKWGQHVTTRFFVFYLIYLFTTTYSVVAICTGQFVDLNSHMSYIFFIVFSLVGNTCLMALAFWQYLFAESYHTYFQNLWNITDITMLLLCHLSIILGAMKGPTDGVRIISTIFTLLLWGRVLYFGRGIEDFSGIVHIMKLIIWDVRYFLLILILFVCAYAISFHLLGIYDSLWLSFFRLFNMMIGDVLFEHSVKGRYIPSLLYLTFLVSVAIILLNALIAFMDNSFRLATTTKSTAVLVSRLKLLTELEVKTLPFVSLFGVQKEEKHLGSIVILLLESEWNATELADQASPLLCNRESRTIAKEFICSVDEGTKVPKDTSNAYSETDTRVMALETKFDDLEKKLDHVIDLLSSTLRKDRLAGAKEDDNESARQEGLSYVYFGDEDDNDSNERNS